MKEFIELLNNTSAARVVFYSIIFLASLSILVDGIVKIVKNLMRKDK